MEKLKEIKKENLSEKEKKGLGKEKREKAIARRDEKGKDSYEIGYIYIISSYGIYWLC